MPMHTMYLCKNYNLEKSWNLFLEIVCPPCIGTKGADLLGEAPFLKSTWPFDHVTHMRSPDILRNLYLNLHKTFGH